MELEPTGSTQSFCEKCLATQLAANPNAEPICELKIRLDSLDTMRPGQAAIEFGRAIIWAEDNQCPPKSKIQPLGQAAYRKLHPGRKFIYPPLPRTSSPIDRYQKGIRREFKENVLKRNARRG